MLWKANAVQIGVWSGLVAGAVVSLLTPSARAAEIVTLRSGFTITCTARESVSGGTLRLYLPTSGNTGLNFIDVPSASVASVEAAAEPFPVAKPSSPVEASQGLNGILQRSGAAHNINVALLAAVIQAESAGNPLALSRTGARGLMQLMPATALELGVKESFQPGDNVNGGSAYLDRLLTRYHENIALALAAYNAGPGAVDRYHGIPPFRETQMYVARVLREFNRRVRQEVMVSTDIPAMLATTRTQKSGSR